MYSNIVAIGAFAWAPSSGVPAGSGVDPSTSNADIGDDGLEEGSGDSEEDVIPDFQTDMARMVGGIHMSSSSNTKSGDKRKERDHYDVRCRKKKTFGIGVQLLTSFVSEHRGTLEDIDMEYKELARESGTVNWGPCTCSGLHLILHHRSGDAVVETLPSAKAISTTRSTSEEADRDFVSYAIKMIYGPFLAFVMLLSPKVLLAFRNHLF
ncbi:hypothetical protein POTOM_057068 [Populus tomentosa]|uniref:Uncharacterized protein n=1 Tax=Populus tomentosa TaxID=118781 RepID=A0A8X7XVT9_POPTO|nr:hypothetical protein POTOM_057068 [Populus tomentosa]